MPREFRLPDLGEGVHEGQIVRVAVNEGVMVREDEPLLEVETDKAAVEIPSPYTGVVTKVHVEAQQLVNVGDVMVTFADADGATSTKTAPKQVAAAAAPSKPAKAIATTTRPSHGGRKPAASPAVRKLARTLGIDLHTVTGTGSSGRITRQDIEALRSGNATTGTSVVKSASSMPAPVTVGPLPVPDGVDDTDQYGPIRRVPLTQARKTIARVMSESWAQIPHVTDCHDADVTQLDQLRRGYSPPQDHPDRKLTLLALIIRAVVRGLQTHPEFNASYDPNAEQIIYRRYVNVAIGVHTERGLIAPVIRDADAMSVLQIADALSTIADKARRATFAVNDTRGGTYTISNPGALGTTRYSTPLITPPQVAVLGLGRARWEPRVVDGAVVPRFVLPLSHSFDHRVIDGGHDLSFMNHLIADLENPARLVL